MTTNRREWMIRPGMLPGLLEAAVDGSGKTPTRTARDWVVDAACLILAAAMAGVALFVPAPVLLPLSPLITTVVAALACVSLLLRRRAPVALTVVLILGSAVLPALSGASLIALFTAAVHRRLPTVMLLALLAGVSAMVQYSVVFAVGGAQYWLAVGATMVLSLLVVGWGMAVRGRRELVLLMADRVRQIQREQESRLREARQAVREGLARDLHDSLAHRLSLISMTAGTLDYRTTASSRDFDEVVEILRWNARQGMNELRQVVTVLRRPDGHAAPGQYHPGGVLDLVAEARASGQEVDLEWSIPGDRLGRLLHDTLYRCVQEGLSNARKHAPGRQVRVTGQVDQRGSIQLTLTNSIDPGEHADGSRSGLLGLEERVSNAGGRLATSVSGNAYQLSVAWPVAVAQRGTDD